jgi:hypothetical protein
MRAGHTITVMVFLTITALSETCARQAQRNVQVAHLEGLSLQRSVCFGTCPEYTVTVEADGHIAFAGGRFVTVSKAEGQASANELKALITALNEVRFLSLNDRYETEVDGCDSVATDHQTVTVSAHFDGRSKTVRHYLGCWKDGPKSATAQSMPPEPPPPWGPGPSPSVREPGCPYPMALVELENRIDSILRTEVWVVKPSPRYERCSARANGR